MGEDRWERLDGRGLMGEGRVGRNITENRVFKTEALIFKFGIYIKTMRNCKNWLLVINNVIKPLTDIDN